MSPQVGGRLPMFVTAWTRLMDSRWIRVKAEADTGRKQGYHGESIITSHKEGNRGGSIELPKFLHSEEPGELHREGTSNVSCTVTRSPNVEEAPRTEEQLSVKVEMLKKNCNINGSSNKEFRIRERTTKNIHKHLTSSYIRTVYTEPSGRTEQTYCPKRMVDIQRNCMDSEFPIWNPQCGSVCLAAKQEGGGILKLVPRQKCPGSELYSLQLVRMA
ncbi:hypothetical protein AYI68_g965 [Smittium mucronatum]|uniref:Uncharacterized protein n=1 Tax=Smittium mucronatum TaxID=133383 RepID=A0A1R0H6P3_9FUNG|nr:hypothetical protein AYI68_g965 [Smittium mucronatum]